MEKHPIGDLMSSSMQNLRNLIDVNTIIGDPITTADGTTIIPVSKVSFGFASGGSDLPSGKPKDFFGGGAGGGVSIQPLAFLVIKGDSVKILQIDQPKNTADRVVGMVPDVIDKVSNLVSNTQKKEDKETEI